MKVKIGILFVVAALAAVAAGAARADVPSLPAGSSWCGESSDAACDASGAVSYVECSDGSVWVIDNSLIDADSFAADICGGEFSVLQPEAVVPDLSDSTDSAPAPAPVTTITGGTDVGLGADANTAPDPTQYVTEVQCPDGSIWAVASGDDFVCPAS